MVNNNGGYVFLYCWCPASNYVVHKMFGFLVKYDWYLHPEKIIIFTQLLSCVLYRPIHSLEDQLILQCDLDALQRWTELWGMRFNPKKCYIMHVRRAESSKMPYFYELCDTVLLSVTDSKYLGIRLSEDLGWGVQVDAACKKANTRLHFIQRNLKSIPKCSGPLLAHYDMFVWICVAYE